MLALAISPPMCPPMPSATTNSGNAARIGVLIDLAPAPGVGDRGPGELEGAGAGRRERTDVLGGYLGHALSSPRLAAGRAACLVLTS